MPIATNGLKKTYGTTVNHIINGASLANTSFSATTDIDNAFSNSDGYPFVDLVLTLTKAAAGSAGLGVNFYKRNLNIVSTNDPPVPSANYKSDFVGFHVVDAVATEQFIVLEGVAVQTLDATEFFIENQTGQTINATWDLDVKPWTWIPA